LQKINKILEEQEIEIRRMFAELKEIYEW
jgi:hypothetical protein